MVRLQVGTLLASAALGLIACDTVHFPADPDDTLVEIERDGRLRVAVVEHTPFVHVDDDGRVDGLEADIVEALARELKVDVEWKPMPEAELPAALADGIVDLGIGGFTATTLYGPKVGLSRPYAEIDGEKHVLFVPAGANRWLLRVESFLHEHDEEIRRGAQRLGARR